MVAGILDTNYFIALGLLSVLSRWAAPLPQPYPRWIGECTDLSCGQVARGESNEASFSQTYETLSADPELLRNPFYTTPREAEE